MRESLLSASGRVQGVGFRYFIKKIAKSFSLRGWVKNEPDKTVTILVQGDDSQVANFVSRIKLIHMQTGPDVKEIKIIKNKQISNFSFANFSISI